jgi:DNA-directed RNA polymerase specialized sigma24 family protein
VSGLLGRLHAVQDRVAVVAIRNELRSNRAVTSALLEQIASGELGPKLHSKVASWHPGARRDEVEEAFQEACLLAERSCRGQTEGEVFTWLRTTTHRELGHMQRRSRSRSRRELLTDVTAPDFTIADAAALAPDELLRNHSLMLAAENAQAVQLWG